MQPDEPCFWEQQPPRTACGPLVSDNNKVGRLGARLAQYITSWSTLLFDTENRSDLLNDELKFYRRGAVDAPRPACCPPPFDVANNWMHEYPQAHVIPFGNGQRSDPEANRLVEWLLFNGARVEKLEKKHRYAGRDTRAVGPASVRMDQPRRGIDRYRAWHRTGHLTGLYLHPLRAAGVVEPRLPLGRRRDHGARRGGVPVPQTDTEREGFAG